MKKQKVMHHIGIAGFGGAGMALYQHFESMEQCKVVSVFDVKSKAFERVKKYSDTLFCTDKFSDFLNSGIDIVVIATPDSTHAEYLEKSVEAGKHVLCEKPLTDSIEGIRKILKVVKTYPQCVVGVQHQMRCLPVHQKIKKIIERGTLGNVGYIEGYYVHNLTRRAFENDNWRLTDNATPLVYSGIHFIDLLRWLMNDEVVEISGMANNICFPGYPESDLNVNLLKFKSGTVGKVVTAFGAARPQDHSVQIYGSQKSIHNNLLFSEDGYFEILARPMAHSLSGRKFAWLKDATIISFSRIIEKLMKLYPYNAQYNIGFYPFRLYEHSKAVATSVSNFLEVVEHGGKLECCAADAAKSVAVALAGVEAYRTGKTIQVKNYWLDEFDHLIE